VDYHVNIVLTQSYEADGAGTCKETFQT